MSSEHAGADGADEPSEGDRVVDLLGLEVVIEEDFVTFPWRAGVARAPVAFALAYATVALLSAVASLGSVSVVGSLAVLGVAVAFVALVAHLVGLGSDATRVHGVGSVAALLSMVLVLTWATRSGAIPFEDQLAILGIVTYNTHHVHAATGLVPESFAPVADPVLALPVVGRLLQGLFAVGQNHAAPVAHFLDVAAGETGTIGHVNLIEQQETSVPKLLYYLVPVGVLGGVGYEFARTHWENAATDSVLEMSRFGIAVGLGYVGTLLAGTVVFTYHGQSPLNPQVFTVMPDRYVTLVFGFVYPAILVSLGATVVYLQRER